MDGEYKTLNNREQAMAHDEYEIKKLKEKNQELVAEGKRLNNEPAGISWASAP